MLLQYSPPQHSRKFLSYHTLWYSRSFSCPQRPRDSKIPKTTAFIADGNFRRVALQFPDPLLREAPEVLWTLQARLRKLKSGSSQNRREVGGAEDGSAAATTAAVEAAAAAAPPLIFVTGDTSYGSCCVDEVSAQHLKADAIVHYGEMFCLFACLLGLYGVELHVPKPFGRWTKLPLCVAPSFGV